MRRALIGLLLLLELPLRGLAAGPDPGAAWRAEWPRTDFARATVPLAEIEPGGPGRDGIPAIDAPRFVPVAEYEAVDPLDPVIALVVGTEAKAYPLQVLIRHEIVNDAVGGVPVTVTCCPLCDTSIVFERGRHRL